MKHKLQSRLLSLLVFLIPIGILFYLAPFDVFVNIKSIEYSDMCVGSNEQVVTLERNVNFSDSYLANSISDMIKIEGQKKIETTIRRKVEFIYQKSVDPVVVLIRWDEPVYEIGNYIAEEYVEINVLGMTKSKLMTGFNNVFRVADCNLTE